MPSLLIDLEVDRVDLVDEGANSEAHIRLYKRKEIEQSMEFKDVIAKMKPEHAAVIEAEVAKAKAEVPEEVAQDLAKAKTDLENTQKELETVSKAKPATEPTEEEVLKGLDPKVQEIFKSMQRQKEAAEALALQAAEKQLNDNAIAKAKQLNALPVDETALVEVVKGLSDEVFDILKAANTAIENAGLLDESGVDVSKTKSTPVSTDDAWAEIEKAAGLIAEEQKITVEKAIGEAIKQNPALYRKYLEGGKQ